MLQLLPSPQRVTRVVAELLLTVLLTGTGTVTEPVLVAAAEEEGGEEKLAW